MLSRAPFAVCAFFAAMAVAAANPAPYKLGMISYNNIFGLTKRQAGYQPSPISCGEGDTCAIACGPGSETCPSNDGNFHCFTPANQTCCPNLSGEACDDGYYCTQDSADETWCCPTGTDLVACAALYTVSALESLSGSATVPPASATTDIALATTTDTIPAAASDTAESTTTDTIPATTVTSTIASTAVATTTINLAITTIPKITFTAVTNPSSSAPSVTLIGTTGLGHTNSTSSAVGATFTGAANKHAVYGLGSAIGLGLVSLVVGL